MLPRPSVGVPVEAARCTLRAVERVKAALHGVLPGQGAVLQDDEERVRLRVRGPDSFGDALAIVLLSIAGSVVLALDGRWAPVRWLAPVVGGWLAYRALARWSGATQVDLEGDELRISRLGAPWPGTSARIPADEVAQLGVVELVEQRSRNVRLRRYALVARLRDGGKRVLATGCHTREPLEEAERAFERRLGIVDVPLHELPSLPERVGSSDDLARPHVDVHTLQPGLVLELGVPRRAGGYRSAVGAERPWLRLSATRALARRDLWLLLVAPLFAAPVVLAVENSSKMGTGMWIVAGLFMTVIALVGYAITSSVVRGILSLLRLEIRDGLVRVPDVEREASTIERVELGGELGSWKVRASGEGFELDLVRDLPDEREARWLVERVREALGLELAPARASSPGASAEAAAEAEADAVDAQLRASRS